MSLVRICGVAYALNLLDLCFTLHALSRGAVEANPIIQSVPFMIFYKVVIIGILCWWLYKQNSSIARRGLRICAAVFACVNIYHLHFILGG